MLLGEGGRGAVQAGLGMSDQLDRNAGHQRLEAALGDETLAEAGVEQPVLEPQPKSAGDYHAGRPVREREVARDRAEREAETVERRGGERVLPLQRQRPDRLVIEARD